MRGLAWACVLLCVACGDDSSSEDAGTEDGSSDVSTDVSEVCTEDDECSDELFCNGAETCDPANGAADARGCVAATDPCMDGRTCDESTDACLTECDINADADGDGVDSAECGGADCDDGNPDRFPGATEVCNAVDEDCDPTTVGERDVDDDGFIDSTCCNGDMCGTDCDDAAPATFPGATEVCDGDDEDCDMAADEGLPVFAYVPDCDEDTFGGDGAAVMGCAPPAMAPASCAAGGVWTTTTGDCDDTNPSRNPGNAEVCNGVDDDCDIDVDDIVDETVVCEFGEMGSCMNACGVPGTGTCTTCLGFDCSSAMTEICNYCDDDGDGNFDEDALLAGFTDTEDMLSCPGPSAPVFGVADCDVEPTTPVGSQLLVATLLDGTANNQAGAVWFTPSDWVVGWGTIDVQITLRARTVPTGAPMTAENPLGGWAIVLDDGGAVGVGGAGALGIPAGTTGVSARWFWSTNFTCIGNPPPDAGDSVRLWSNQPLRPPGVLDDWSCSDGSPVGSDLNSQTTFVAQTMRLRYTANDPNTVPNEEEATIDAGGTSITWRADTTDMPRLNGDLTPGAPLRIGITAGTYTATGFDTADGITFGVPVEARITMWRMGPPPSGGGPPPFDMIEATVSRGGLCPP